MRLSYDLTRVGHRSRGHGLTGQRTLVPFSLSTCHHLLLIALLLTWSLVDGNLNSTQQQSSPSVLSSPLDGNLSLSTPGNQSRDIESVPPIAKTTTSDTNETTSNYRPLIAGKTTTLTSSRSIENQSTVAQVNQENGTDLHSTFLLLCSANSIRYWSASCPVHSSADLLTHSRSSSIPHGITSIALWRPDPTAVQLLWYDAAESAFHRAAISRRHATDCDNLLGIEFNETLSYKTNPFVGEAEARVKLAVDSERHLLFASNFLNNRVDVYRLDAVAKNELQWLASWSTVHPFDIALDETEGKIFWVEDKVRLCHLSYRFEAKHLKHNLTNMKVCTADLDAAPQALTLDPATRMVIWGDRNGQLYKAAYDGLGNNTESLGKAHDLHEVTNLAMSTGDSLYLSDDHEVHRLNVTSGTSDIVSIESNIQFGLLVLDRMPETVPTTTTVAPLTSSTTVPSTASPAPSPSTFSPLPSPSDQSSTTTILLFVLVPSLLSVILIAFCILFCCTAEGHQHLSSLKTKLHFNPGSRTSKLFNIRSRFTRYNQLRNFKQRANSTGRDQLIEEDIEAAPEASEPITAECRPPPSRTATNYYRANITRQSPGMEDIEDILGSRPQPVAPRPCIACRDSDICQDKGICMATYRVF